MRQIGPENAMLSGPISFGVRSPTYEKARSRRLPVVHSSRGVRVDAAVGNVVCDASNLLGGIGSGDHPCVLRVFETVSSAVSRTRVLQALLSGLLLFGLPPIISAEFIHGLPQPTRIVFLALIPVAIVLIQSFREPDTDFMNLLAASLAGVAGLVLVVPTDFAVCLREPSSVVLFGVVIVSIASGSYLGYVAARGLPQKLFVVLMLSPSLLLSSLQTLIAHKTVGLPDAGGLLTIVFAGVQLTLTAYLVGSVAPVAFSTRYLLVPLTTAIEGLVYMHPAVTWRIVAGLLALLLGVARLLVKQDSRPDSAMSLL